MTNPSTTNDAAASASAPLAHAAIRPAYSKSPCESACRLEPAKNRAASSGGSGCGSVESGTNQILVQVRGSLSPMLAALFLQEFAESGQTMM